MLLIQGLGDLGDSNVLALQQALVKLGKSVSVTGTMNDSTVAALWVVVKGNVTKARDVAKLISSEASTAIGWFVSAMGWIDEQVKKIPGGIVTTELVLKNWVNFNSVFGYACFGNSTCLSVVKQLVDARASTFSSLTRYASVFTKIALAFGAPTVAPPTTPPPIKISAMTFSPDIRRLAVDAKASQQPPPPPPPPPPVSASKVPAFVQQWWFWALVGLTGGALIARRAA